MESVGNRIRKLRKDSRWTQEQLAKLINVSPQVVSNWERGYTPPGPDDIARLAKVFNASSDYILLGRTDDLSPSNKNSDPSELDLLAFSDRLAKGLEQHNITIKQAADQCSVSESYIQQLISSPTKAPGLSTLYKLANLIDVTPDYLSGFTGDPKGYSSHAPKPKDLKNMLETSDVMFDGIPLSEGDKERITGFMEAMFWEAKKMNRRKK